MSIKFIISNNLCQPAICSCSLPLPCLKGYESSITVQFTAKKITVGHLLGDGALLARVSFGQIGSMKQIALVDLRILECELVEENLLTALPSLFVEADLKSDADAAADDDVVA